MKHASAATFFSIFELFSVPIHLGKNDRALSKYNSIYLWSSWVTGQILESSFGELPEVRVAGSGIFCYDFIVGASLQS